MAGARKTTMVIKERRGIVSVNMLLQRLTVLFEISKPVTRLRNGGKRKKNEVKKKKKIQSSSERAVD